MLIADDLIVNPEEAPVVPARTEQSLSELGISVRGADWGESASGQSGSEPKTRTIVLDLVCREEDEVSLPEAAIRLQQIVGQMQEEPETWIKRVPKVGGEWAGPVMYRIRRSPTAEEPQVTLSGLGGWQVGDNQPVTLTIVADFPAYSTAEVEGKEHSTTGEDRSLIYTDSAPGGSTRGLSRTVVTNDNKSGDLRGLIFGREVRDYSADATAKPWYECYELQPLGGAEKVGLAEPRYVSVSLTEGWRAVLGTKIGSSHMTHRGGRRIWMRVADLGSTPGNVQFKLVWRALGSSRWEDLNPVSTVYPVEGYALIDLGSVLPQNASTGDQRWEGKVMARVLSGTGEVNLIDFYPLPTEQYMKMSESEEASIDGEPQKAPATLEDATGVGTVTWSEPTKATVTPSTGGASLTLEAGKTSHYLKATNLGLGSLVPEGAIIKGIGVAFYGYAGTANAVFDNVIRLIIGGTVKTPSLASAEAWSATAAGESRIYGGPTNLWEQSSISRADVVASNFGVAISVKCPSLASTFVLAGLRVIVYYTEGQNEPVICTTERSIEIASNGVRRQIPTDDVWGTVTPDGFLPYATPGALEGLTQRTIIIPTRGDLGERVDTEPINALSAKDFTRAGYHVAQGTP